MLKINTPCQSFLACASCLMTSKEDNKSTPNGLGFLVHCGNVFFWYFLCVTSPIPLTSPPPRPEGTRWNHITFSIETRVAVSCRNSGCAGISNCILDKVFEVEPLALQLEALITAGPWGGRPLWFLVTVTMYLFTWQQKGASDRGSIDFSTQVTIPLVLHAAEVDLLTLFPLRGGNSFPLTSPCFGWLLRDAKLEM